MTNPVLEDDVVEILREQGRRVSEISRAAAEAKSLRQADNQERRTDLYMWTKPEQTLEWKSAALIEQQRRTIEELRGEASFLVDRLDSLEFSDLDDVYRDYAGHVEPSVSRLRALLQGDKKE